MRTKVLLSILAVAVIPNLKPMATPAGLLNKAVVAQTSGTVASLGANSLTVTTATGTVTVNTQANTVFLRRFGGKSDLAEFSTGDQVTVIGKTAGTATTSIDARLIRNASIQKRYGTFAGTVQGVSTTGFTLQPDRRPSQSVTVTAKTKITDRQGKTLPQTSLAAGHRVRFHGLWDNKLNTVTEVAYVRDYSLPIPKTPVATPSATR
jgi:hypothetical protein